MHRPPPLPASAATPCVRRQERSARVTPFYHLLLSGSPTLAATTRIEKFYFAAAPSDVASSVPGMPYKAIVSLIGTLMEQNAQAFNQISKNIASHMLCFMCSYECTSGSILYGHLNWSLIIICIPDKGDELGSIILHLDSLSLHSSISLFDNIKRLG
ncbi:hypothetical protein AHAS_Ahas19G0034500 [Arachis hypogaea]